MQVLLIHLLGIKHTLWCVKSINHPNMVQNVCVMYKCMQAKLNEC